ncbi:DNA polymerase subunit delta-2 [Yarrowia sp. C11]|nr:DNA polymerase subunit delta-2 [Yarrowia sp. E02]KAG5369489.1 DNA polymerase subunit delta-2 [Yarrowia sp. C11]
MPEIRANLPAIASPLNDGFTLPITKRNYNRQYAPIYYMRLHQLMSQVLDSATSKWADKNVKYLNKCLDVLVGDTVFVVGTLFKEMKYKPSMLEEVTRSHWGAPPGKKPKYVDPQGDESEDGGHRDDSSIQLEDSSGRITLVGPKVQEFMLITGVVCAVLGTAGENGRFTVVDVVWGGFPEQVHRPLSGVSEDVEMADVATSEDTEDKYICLASGLYIGQKKTDYKHVLLAEYLQGLLDDDSEPSSTSPKARNISRLILAGNNCAPESERPVIDTLSRTVDLDAFKPMARVDEYIAQLLPSMSVDIMAGNDDPGNMSLPQQPLHLSMFPLSRKFKTATFASVTNPHWWDFSSEKTPLKVLGTSGQNVSDIYKYLVEGRDDILDIMEHTLAWRHLCPTAPDTLTCYPYGEDDPFIIRETPHVYFCGNQDEFQTSVIHHEGVSVRLVAVPRFDETGEVVLVNTRTLKAEVVKVVAE